MGRTDNMKAESWKDSCSTNIHWRNFRSADIQKQLHFLKDTWRPERTSWRRKNAMILWNACVYGNTHTVCDTVMQEDMPISMNLNQQTSS